MQMHSVTSSQIKEIGYDSKAFTMAIRFNTGALYHYTGVTEKDYDDFKNAKSIGAHFGRHIKGVHEYKRIHEDKKEQTK